MIDINLIRNFVIIAHIDHGKSTLADRMLEITGTVSKEKMKPQILDSMDLERERGITIKLQPIRMNYSHSDRDYIFNLIDTPGHEDFSYEVSRSLAAVEGAVLVVDATKGIQAQTLANLQHAKDNNLAIIPVVNKIDLPNAEVEETLKEIAQLLKIDSSEILKVSAKTGEGVTEILNRIIEKVPAPKGEKATDFKALIFDSVYDSYRGVIAYVKVFEGSIKRGDKMFFMETQISAEAVEVGEFKLKYQAKDNLEVGEIGYIVTGAKSISEVQVGDTIIHQSPEEVSPILGYKKPQSYVFASFFTVGSDVNHLRVALEKLTLNDSSLNYEPENSVAFGHGFRCGFLGLLHMEIVKERLEREYNLDLVITQPSVEYTVNKEGGFEEPWVNLEIITPSRYLGQVMELAQKQRAVYKDTQYFGDRSVLYYESPLSEIIVQFYDQLKSVSSGYASQNYELIGWRAGDLVKLDVLVAGQKVEEFGKVVSRERMAAEAKNLASKLKNLIPKQMFEVSIQIADGGHIIAREDISAMKKDVIAKLYGGDVNRKNKLLKKQAKGKKKMKMLGRLEIPDSVFMEILKQ